jgi:ribosome-associated translation inhibitor RaiA
MCERCGAVYTRKTWRGAERADKVSMVGLGWTVCPACRQLGRSEYFGRVLVPGGFARAHEQEIRARIRRVDARARFTQPLRRVVSVSWDGPSFEVLTTSQKLAHRVARELEKSYGGRAEFSWSDRDGELFATWRPESAAVPAKPTAGRRSRREPAGLVLEMQTRHTRLDPLWRDLIEAGAARLRERHRDLGRLRFTLDHGRHHRQGAERVTVVADVPERTLRVEKDGETMTDALRAALVAMGRELGRRRERRRSYLRGSKASAAEFMQ